MIYVVNVDVEVEAKDPQEAEEIVSEAFYGNLYMQIREVEELDG